MILELERVRWKNFNSYGEMWTEISLNRNPITVVIGKNGFGKSTFTDALSFNLFGKAIRKNKKGNLINRRNKKGLLTETYFNIDGVPYMVRRGLKPDVFEIYKDDFAKPINQDAASRDYQKLLEQNILKMNFVTFTQSVVVSKTLYTPFMTLPTPKRREFVENILRLKVFGDMSKLHKAKHDKLKDEYDDVKYDFDKLCVKHTELENSIVTIRNMIEANTKEKSDMIQTQIDDKQKTITDLVAEYKAKEKTLLTLDNTVKSRYNAQYKLLIKLENKRDELNQTISDLTNGENKCSLCGTGYSKDHVQQHLDEATEKLGKVDKAIDKLTIEVNDLKILVDQYDKDATSNTTTEAELNGIKRLLASTKAEQDRLKNDLKNIVIDTSQLDKANDNLYNVAQDKQAKELLLKDLSKKVDYSNLSTTMLKDSGFKSQIINQSIPLINKLINKNLSDFGFFVKFELDSEFNETISVRGFESASYNDFSEGEKLRIDMAILLAWRDIAMLQNAMFCNVLFLDEITDASMDDEGTEIFAKMLTLLKENNVFIITHKPEKLDNIARSTIKIDKKDGYSTISTN